MNEYVKTFNALPISDYRYIKTKIRTYGDTVYTNSDGLNLLEIGIECESFAVIYIDSLLVYKNKYYLQIYLDICPYKTVDKRMIYYLGESTFETDED